MISARRRGTISTSIGSSPITRSASISSRIFIEPISAVKAEPERPATMIAVSSTPTSRSVRMPTRSTTNGVAPKLLQLEDALLGDDAADQERDQRDDRHAAEGDELELVHERRPAEAPRPRRDPHHGDDDLAEEADPGREILAGCNDRLRRSRTRKSISRLRFTTGLGWKPR